MINRVGLIEHLFSAPFGGLVDGFLVGFEVGFFVGLEIEDSVGPSEGLMTSAVLTLLTSYPASFKSATMLKLPSMWAVPTAKVTGLSVSSSS